MSAPKRLEECLNVLDLRDLARRRLPAAIYAYLVGAAETEATAHRNTAAFDDLQLIPQCLVDVATVSTATRVLGQELQWPVFCSPTGASRLFHADGELAVARAATRAGTLYGLSAMATHSLESVAAAADGPKMFQMFIFKDREITRELIDRCKRAGYKALCLTVDTPVRGNCERERRLGLFPRVSFKVMVDFASHPHWTLSQFRKGRLSVPIAVDLTGDGQFFANSHFIGTQLNPSASWKDVREVSEWWEGALAIKGIMSADDAARAVDAGATAVIVSNHGGRQLDGAAATIEMLPEIVRAVGDRTEVILDGGVRRGVHILKALALGAKACSIGRAYLYGLGAGGEAGVTKSLEILRSELMRAMQLVGCADVGHVDPALVRHF